MLTQKYSRGQRNKIHFLFLYSTLFTVAVLMIGYAMAVAQKASSLDENLITANSGDAARLEVLKGEACGQMKVIDA